MKYLIIPKDSEPFMTSFFDYENHYEVGMIVINNYNATYTRDGKTWHKLKFDSL
jgi:hypothetical protein